MITSPPDRASGLHASDATLAQAIHKAGRRLLPFLMLLYIVAFLDRVNIGYVKQSYLEDTGFGESVFAMGAGIFFVGYALLEIPSNLILAWVGARLWIGRIMITWGLVAAVMMFAWTPASFYALRSLLGVMEAGFFPGMILYLSLWFPADVRGRMIGLFYFGAPCAQIIGGPVSGLLLDLHDVGGLRGWQWVFLVEGLLAVAVGIWTLRWLPNRPAEARWLTGKERSALQAAMDVEERSKTDQGEKAAAGWGRLWVLALIYGLIQISVYGVTFYLPFRVTQLLGMNAGFAAGVISAIPWLCALLAAYAVPRLASRSGCRRLTATLSLGLAGLGIGISAVTNPWVGMLGLCVATAGFIGVQPVFWTIPTEELAGRKAAWGIALINSMGAAGGFLGPNLKTAAELSWASPWAGSIVLAAASLLAAALVFVVSGARGQGTQPGCA